MQELIETHGKRVYGMCLRLTRSRMDADDLYQETFLQVMQIMNLPDFKENPLPFIMQCCLWKAKSSRRRFARRQRIAPTETYADVYAASESDCEENAEKEELHTFLRGQVESLPENYKEPVLLYYNADMPLEQIAKTLGCPVGTVKSRLFRAKQILKQRLEENGYEGF